MKNKFNRKIASTIIVTTSIIMSTSSFAANLTPFKDLKSGKWGFENKVAKQVISVQYDGVGQFKNGYAAVRKNNLWGFVDQNGKLVVPIVYDAVTDFLNGYAPVIKGNKMGIVNTIGKEVISLKYEQLSYFGNDGNLYAKKDGKWGKIDKLENIVVPFLYNEIDQKTEYTISSSKVVLDGEKVVIDIYQIDNNNYVKIRDISKALDGSEKQFEVSWNREKKMIDLLSGERYTEVGGELKENEKKTTSKLRFTQSPIAKDSEKIVLQGYNIDDNNYFKIRDIAKEFNIGLGWNHEMKTIEIDTTADYIEE